MLGFWNFYQQREDKDPPWQRGDRMLVQDYLADRFGWQAFVLCASGRQSTNSWWDQRFVDLVYSRLTVCDVDG